MKTSLMFTIGFMKNTRSWGWVYLLAAACAALPGPGVGAADWKFSSSFNYNTGTYGGAGQTDSIYIPFTLKRYYREGNISLTAPYLRQSSTGQVVRVGGNTAVMGKKSGAARTAGESGLADAIINGSYTLKKDGPKSFDLAAAGRLKLPTADESRGLGTGELDLGSGLEFAKELRPGLTLLVDGYYTIIGDPAGVDLNNELALDIGIFRQFRKDLSLTVLYATRGAIVDGNADPREISGTLYYASADGNNYFGGLLLGLSDGSPDAGISVGLSRRF